MSDRRRVVHVNQHGIGILFAIGIAAAMVVIAIVTVPQGIKFVIVQLVMRKRVSVEAVVAVVMQEQPALQRHPNEHREEQREQHRHSTS